MRIFHRLTDTVPTEHWTGSSRFNEMLRGSRHLAITGWDGSGMTTLIGHLLSAAVRDNRPVALFTRDTHAFDPFLNRMPAFSEGRGGVVGMPWIEDLYADGPGRKAEVRLALEVFAKTPGAVIALDKMPSPVGFEPQDIIGMIINGATVITGHITIPTLLLRDSADVLLRCELSKEAAPPFLKERHKTQTLSVGEGLVRRPGGEWLMLRFDSRSEKALLNA